MSATEQQMEARAKLGKLLLTPEDWPPGFTWRYTDTTHCTLGLAWKAGMIDYKDVAAFHDAANDIINYRPTQLGEVLGLTVKQIDVLIYGVAMNTLGRDRALITPEDAAFTLANIDKETENA